jgi:hypothetical protein
MVGSDEVKNLACLDLKKRNCLIDFISTLPAVATRAASYENIMHGFYVTGYLDRETRRYPVAKNKGDFLGMIMIK